MYILHVSIHIHIRLFAGDIRRCQWVVHSRSPSPPLARIGAKSVDHRWEPWYHQTLLPIAVHRRTGNYTHKCILCIIHCGFTLDLLRNGAVWSYGLRNEKNV